MSQEYHFLGEDFSWGQFWHMIQVECLVISTLGRVVAGLERNLKNAIGEKGKGLEHPPPLHQSEETSMSGALQSRSDLEPCCLGHFKTD